MKKHYVGLDVSNNTTSICIIDEKGKIVKEMIAETNPKSIDAELRAANLHIESVGIETGGMTDWLATEIRKLHWHVVCLDAFKMSKLISININKIDKNDSRLIAEAARINCLSNFNIEVHTRSLESRMIRTLIRTRQSLVSSRISLYNEIRGNLKGYGHKVATACPEVFCIRLKEIMNDLPPLLAKGILPMLSIYEVMSKEINALTETIETMGKQNENVKLLTQEPGIGVITALYFLATIDDPKRFKNPKAVGAYIGLTPSQYSSGESEKQFGISKRGDKVLRSLLFECATTVLYRSKRKNQLKTWGLKIKKKAGSNKAKVAVARKLSIRMYETLLAQKPYVEKVPQGKPKPKHQDLEYSTEELLNLVDLSKRNHGYLRVKNSNELKPLAKSFEIIYKHAMTGN